jgi:L-lysine exporter family protein LysE/ArgO
MDWTSFPAGFAACALLIVAIGPQNAFVLRQALRNQHVMAIVITCVLADALLISIGVAGLDRVIEGRPWALDVTRWLGAGFLFVYGAKALWRARASHGLVAVGADNPTLRGTLGTLTVLTFLNPHVSVVLLGVGARFVSGFFASPRAWRYLDVGLGAGMVALAVGLAVE